MQLQKIRLVGAPALQVMLWIVAIAVLVQNFVLARHNNEMQAMLMNSATEIPAGTTLHGIAGLTLDGHLRTIAPPGPGSHTLFITFSPGCPACRASEKSWARLTRQMELRGWQVIWVSRDPSDTTKDYAESENIPTSNVILDPPYRTYLQLALKAVPNIVAVGSGGIVEKVWPGSVDTAGWKDALGYLGLPGRVSYVK